MHLKTIYTFLTLAILGQFTVQAQEIRYFPLGDSYTKGERIESFDNYPSQFVRAVEKQKISIKLIENLSETGYTTSDLLREEMPSFLKSDANFTTICIGVNDWVQGVDAASFEKNFQEILKKTLKKLGKPTRILVLTIPDFSANPTGKKYGKGRDITAGIASFNAIIIKNCKQNNIAVADIFEGSKKAEKNSLLTANDGLHPSALAYKVWVDELIPLFLKNFNK